MSVGGHLRFPGQMRVRRRSDFRRVMRRGRSAPDRLMRVWVLPNGLEHSRFGLVVGRRHGGAVSRNRVKRVLREAFRLSQCELPGGLDIACSPHVGVEIGLPGARQSLLRLTARLARDARAR